MATLRSTQNIYVGGGYQCQQILSVLYHTFYCCWCALSPPPQMFFQIISYLGEKKPPKQVIPQLNWWQIDSIYISISTAGQGHQVASETRIWTSGARTPWTNFNDKTNMGYWEIYFFQRKILLCTHHSACVIHSLEVCKYNFTEAGVAVFQSLYIGHGWRGGSRFLTSTSK